MPYNIGGVNIVVLLEMMSKLQSHWPHHVELIIEAEKDEFPIILCSENIYYVHLLFNFHDVF